MMPSTNRMPPPRRVGSAVVRVAVAEPADVDRRRPAPPPATASAAEPPPPAGAVALPVGPHPVVRLRHPLEAEILDGVGVDVLEQAEALAAHVAGVAGPLIRQRLLDDVGRIQPADVRVGTGRRGLERLALPVGMAGSADAGILAGALCEEQRGSDQQRRDDEQVSSSWVSPST